MRERVLRIESEACRQVGSQTDIHREQTDQQGRHNMLAEEAELKAKTVQRGMQKRKRRDKSAPSGVMTRACGRWAHSQ